MILVSLASLQQTTSEQSFAYFMIAREFVELIWRVHLLADG